MFSRSCSTLSTLALAALLAFGTAGCMKAKKKPEVRLARDSKANTDMPTLTADQQRSFGSNDWAPGGAPPATGFDGSGSMSIGGDTGFEYDPAAVAYDESTGAIQNDASLDGVEAGSFVADLEMVHFPYDSSEIAPEWQVVLDGHAGWLLAHPDVMVQVEGHTDERGTEEYNVSLGQRRADSVREYLASSGVDPKRLTTISYGELRPIDYDQTEESHNLNRRAMFLVYQMENQDMAAAW